MTSTQTIRDRKRKVAPDSPDKCPHCANGWVYEATEDTLTDEAHECWMCLGTGRRMDRAERIRLRADLDAHHSCLERLES